MLFAQRENLVSLPMVGGRSRSTSLASFRSWFLRPIAHCGYGSSTGAEG